LVRRATEGAATPAAAEELRTLIRELGAEPMEAEPL
jgi:hypothetical protein